MSTHTATSLRSTKTISRTLSPNTRRLSASSITHRPADRRLVDAVGGRETVPDRAGEVTNIPVMIRRESSEDKGRHSPISIDGEPELSSVVRRRRRRAAKRQDSEARPDAGYLSRCGGKIDGAAVFIIILHKI